MFVINVIKIKKLIIKLLQIQIKLYSEIVKQIISNTNRIILFVIINKIDIHVEI